MSSNSANNDDKDSNNKCSSKEGDELAKEIPQTDEKEQEDSSNGFEITKIQVPKSKLPDLKPEDLYEGPEMPKENFNQFPREMEEVVTAEKMFNSKQTIPVKTCLPTNECICGESPCVRHRYCGLYNDGFTCYINSVLQIIYQTKPLRSYFSVKNDTLGPFHAHLAGLFETMDHKAIAYLDETVYPATSAEQFTNLFRTAKPEFRAHQQHDCQEFFAILLELVHQEANQVKKRDKPTELSEPKTAQEAWDDHVAHVDNSYLSNLFMGQMESTLSCLSCGHKSLSWSAFWQLQLQIVPDSLQHDLPPVTLQDCIKNLTAEEVRVDYLASV